MTNRRASDDADIVALRIPSYGWLTRSAWASAWFYAKRLMLFAYGWFLYAGLEK